MAENNDIKAKTGKEEKIMGLLEEITAESNMALARQRVKRNKGSAGIDGMTVQELDQYFMESGAGIRQSIMDGKYRPQPVRGVEIPKDNGKKRQLGIPTAVDRTIQQAITMKLTPIFEPLFSDTSYGFRPGRSAHDAINKCLEYLNDGHVWTVDMDLEKFFDNVNQSKLIQLLSDQIDDGRVISLIHKYLKAGRVWCGRYDETACGVPQGGPLSPLCANVVLNELDHELERRGHKFVRYADDMIIFCRSKASAEQTLKHIIPYIEKKLFLKVNMEKTVVAYATKIKYLGFGFTKSKDGFKPRVHTKSKAKMRKKVEYLTQRNDGKSYEERKIALRRFVVGWVNYFKAAQMNSFLKEVDGWMRRRIRSQIWTRWKRMRTRYSRLRQLGADHGTALKMASSRKGSWRIAKTKELSTFISNERLARAGYQSFFPYYVTVKA
jgi:group II intron reverse transcriptase/maturase